MQHERLPDRIVSVFAGQDLEATAKARSYIEDHPPTSPAFALFKDGRLVHLIQRHQIEGVAAHGVAASLVEAFDQHCG